MRSVGGYKKRSVVCQTNSPGALKVKAGVKLVSMILVASTASQESRLDITSGKGYFSECPSRWLRSDAFSTWTSAEEMFRQRGAECFLRAKYTVRSYWSYQYNAGNKTKKSSDELPTDQEHWPGDRADQAQRVQLTARSTSFGSLIFGGAHKSIFVLVGCFFI